MGMVLYEYYCLVKSLVAKMLQEGLNCRHHGIMSRSITCSRNNERYTEHRYGQEQVFSFMSIDDSRASNKSLQGVKTTKVELYY